MNKENTNEQQKQRRKENLIQYTGLALGIGSIVLAFVIHTLIGWAWLLLWLYIGYRLRQQYIKDVTP